MRKNPWMEVCRASAAGAGGAPKAFRRNGAGWAPRNPGSTTHMALFVSGKDCPSVKASAAQKKKKPDAQTHYWIFAPGSFVLNRYFSITSL